MHRGPFSFESVAPMKPTLEKTVKLNNIETALIYSRPPLYGHARFYYVIARATETGFSLSEPFTGFYSVDHAENEIAIYAETSPSRTTPPVERKPDPVPTPRPPRPPHHHFHYCFYCPGNDRKLFGMECVNPRCKRWRGGRNPVRCPRCWRLTDNHNEFYYGRVTELVPPARAEAVAAD